MKDDRAVEIGKIYKHYKGNEYKVLCIAKHSETLEDMVVYQGQYGKMEIWARPISMFLEKVMVNGKMVYRFEEKIIEAE